MNTISRTTLATTLFDLGVPADAVEINDAEYSVPDPGWIAHELPRPFMDYLKVIGRLRYSAESNDCDNFAAECSVYAKRFWAYQFPGTPELCFGTFKYPTGGGRAHVLCAGLEAWPNRLVLFEPIRQKVIQLSIEKINSCLRFTI